ncbi:hypothetical protein KSP40_PGU000263 [Platanthera guangdongensis]|uniref:Uncharacterized protein n=1 Tax=Platanthera guangdongensis TaxID=2320717 RepID=A0ABR2MWH3_9ASPA
MRRKWNSGLMRCLAGFCSGHQVGCRLWSQGVCVCSGCRRKGRLQEGITVGCEGSRRGNVRGKLALTFWTWRSRVRNDLGSTKGSCKGLGEELRDGKGLRERGVLDGSSRGGREKKRMKLTRYGDDLGVDGRFRRWTDVGGRNLGIAPEESLGFEPRRPTNYKSNNGKYLLVKDDEIGWGMYDKPLRCYGCGIGWFCFLTGILCPLVWYYATFLYFSNHYRKDPRERAGLAASAIAVSPPPPSSSSDDQQVLSTSGGANEQNPNVQTAELDSETTNLSIMEVVQDITQAAKGTVSDAQDVFMIVIDQHNQDKVHVNEITMEENFEFQGDPSVGNEKVIPSVQMQQEQLDIWLATPFYYGAHQFFLMMMLTPTVNLYVRRRALGERGKFISGENPFEVEVEPGPLFAISALVVFPRCKFNEDDGSRDLKYLGSEVDVEHLTVIAVPNLL